MAVVTAIYDAVPAPRTAADILPADQAERAARQPGPKTSNRKMDASLQHSTAPMVAALFDQAETRDPNRQRRWIALVDGANHQLECLETEAKRRGVQIDIIVDFIHVLEYLSAPRKRSVVSPVQRGEIGGTSLGLMAYLEPERERGQQHASEPTAMPRRMGWRIGGPA